MRLTSAKVRQFRELLENRKLHLVSATQPRWSSVTPDRRREREMEVESAEFDLAVRQRPAELHRVMEALKRLDRGTYGSCTGCGGEIEEGRLLALLVTDLCTSCQRTIEAAHQLEHRWDRTPWGRMAWSRTVFSYT